MSSIKRNRIMAIIVAFAMCVSMMAVMTTTETYAASKPSRVKVYSAKARSYNSITLKWYKAKNAKKYQVYRATKKYGKYKRMWTTTKRSYTNTCLSFNKTYYYKVRAVNGKKKGSFSKIKSVKTRIGTPNIEIMDVNPKSISVLIDNYEWNGAHGYYIYRADSVTGPFEKIGKFKKDYEWYTDVNVETGKTYYYKVIAYRVLKSKKIYSSYSRVLEGTAEFAYPEETSKLNVSYSYIKDKDDPRTVVKITNNNINNVYIGILYIYKDCDGKILSIYDDYGAIPTGKKFYNRDYIMEECDYLDIKIPDTVEVYAYVYDIDERNNKFANEQIELNKEIYGVDEDGEYTYKALVKNNGKINIEKADMVVLYKDSNGNVVDVYQDIFWDIVPGEIQSDYFTVEFQKYSSFDMHLNYAVINTGE